MNNIIVNLICFLHVILVILVVIVPFLDIPYLLMLYTVFVPFMILHWVTNDNTCVLTTIEKYARNVTTKDEEDECFTCRLINPVFDFRKNNIDQTAFIYTATITLWIIAVIKLSWKYKTGELRTFRDMFKIRQHV